EATPATQPDALQPEPVPRNAASDGELSEEERRRMIARAAYLIAQRRGFEHGLELGDWLVAAAEVNARLANSTSAPSSAANTQCTPVFVAVSFPAGCKGALRHCPAPPICGARLPRGPTRVGPVV